MATNPIQSRSGGTLAFTRVKYQLAGDLERWVPQELPEVDLPFLVIKRVQKGSWIEVKSGFAWDGASGPMPDWGVMVASCVHDACFAAIRKGFMDPGAVWAANDVFYHLAKAGGTPRWLAWLAWKVLLLAGRWALRHPHPTRRAS